jgi:hypothetical protein
VEDKSAYCVISRKLLVGNRKARYHYERQNQSQPILRPHVTEFERVNRLSVSTARRLLLEPRDIIA